LKQYIETQVVVLIVVIPLKHIYLNSSDCHYYVTLDERIG